VTCGVRRGRQRREGLLQALALRLNSAQLWAEPLEPRMHVVHAQPGNAARKVWRKMRPIVIGMNGSVALREPLPSARWTKQRASTVPRGSLEKVQAHVTRVSSSQTVSLSEAKNH